MNRSGKLFALCLLCALTLPGCPAKWARPPLTGRVTITGRALVGERLTADISALDGSGTALYRWKRADSSGGPYSDITNAQYASYRLTAADLGKYIKVTVILMDCDGGVTSDAVLVCVLLSYDANGGVLSGGTPAGGIAFGETVTLPSSGSKTGYALTGFTLSGALTGTKAPGGAFTMPAGAVTAAAEWRAAASFLDLTGAVTTPAAGAAPDTAAIDTDEYTGTVEWQNAGGTAFTGSAFAAYTVYKALVTLTAKDGFTFTGVKANSFTHTGAASVTNAADSGTVTITFPEMLPALMGTVSITGTAAMGQTLTANTASLVYDTSGTLSYQWKAGGDNVGTNQTYTPALSDYGKTITVTVTASKNAGSVESAAAGPVVSALSYEANGGALSGGTPAGGIARGATVTLPSSGSKTGYALTGFTLSGALTGTKAPGGAFTMPAGAVTATAEWRVVPDGWIYDGATGRVTATYAYTGGAVAWTPPVAGTVAYTFEAWGGDGGSVSANGARSGGAGGYAKGTLSAASGTTLYFYVGAAASAWNGGGLGGNSGYPGVKIGGTGGGASSISLANGAWNNATVLARRILAAGGGGGADWGNGKNGGGLSGASGSRATGGTQTAGGSGDNSGAWGAGGQGGPWNSSEGYSGGGGGGGYYGGGGSSGKNYGTGGGGGSGYVFGLAGCGGEPGSENEYHRALAAGFPQYQFSGGVTAASGESGFVTKPAAAGSNGYIRVSYVPPE
ncbi:MAG: hypothetical protein MdMp014T_2374 [Treponematales bacterium]